MQLSCDLCKTDRGPCIQCTFNKKCYSAAHPLCARAAGWKMTIKEDETNGIRLDSVCLRCQAKQKKGACAKKRKSAMAEAEPREEAVAVAVAKGEEDPSPRLAGEAPGGCSRIVPHGDLRAMGALAGSARAVPYVVSGARGVQARISGKSKKSPVASVSIPSLSHSLCLLCVEEDEELTDFSATFPPIYSHDRSFLRCLRAWTGPETSTASASPLAGPPFTGGGSLRAPSSSRVIL